MDKCGDSPLLRLIKQLPFAKVFTVDSISFQDLQLACSSTQGGAIAQQVLTTLQHLDFISITRKKMWANTTAQQSDDINLKSGSTAQKIQIYNPKSGKAGTVWKMQIKESSDIPKFTLTCFIAGISRFVGQLHLLIY